MESNLGKVFERQFKISAEKDGLFIIRFNDTDLSWNNNNVSRFTCKNPADFQIFECPFLFFLELKHTLYNSIGIQRSPDENDKMIKFSQINSLTQMSVHKGCYCGFILSFSSTDKKTLVETEDTYFINIKDFNRFLVDSEKKSINKTDVVLYNGIRLEQEKKRVRYIYNVKKMLQDIIST